MRPLTRAETETIARELAPFVGAQLQECVQVEDEIGLALYGGGAVSWLWFDFDPRRPFVALYRGSPPFKSRLKKKSPKPLSLFVRAHLVGRRLTAVECDKAFGRVLTLFFFAGPAAASEPPVRAFEARLFPHGQNAIARAAGKSVSLRPQKDLQEGTEPAHEESSPRAWPAIQLEWEISKGDRGRPAPAKDAPPAAAPVESQEIRTWRRALEKKSRALEKMREDLSAKTNSRWAEVGEWLKASGDLGCASDWPEPAVWAEALNLERSFSWNMQNCFTKAKDAARKIAAARARLSQVEAELVRLRKQEPRPGREQTSEPTREPTGKRAPSLLAKAEARGRKLSVANDVEAYVGKSATDNMALLRRAQAHDYWLHLRDFPSAHAILRRPKARAIADAEFTRTGLWLVEQSLKKSAGELAGQSFDLLIAECRHVRAIKGDKLGRVHYANERVLRVGFR